MLAAIRVLAVTAILGTARRLHVGGAPWLRADRAQEGAGVERAGEAALHAKVKVRINETVNDRDGGSVTNTRIVDTTVGRALLFQVVPKGL